MPFILPDGRDRARIRAERKHELSALEDDIETFRHILDMLIKLENETEKVGLNTLAAKEKFEDYCVAVTGLTDDLQFDITRLVEEAERLETKLDQCF